MGKERKDRERERKRVRERERERERKREVREREGGKTSRLGKETQTSSSWVRDLIIFSPFFERLI